MEEIWKDIKGFSGKYKVSNYGNIQNVITNKMLKPYIGSQGYYRIGLYINRIGKVIEVHRLVADAFIDNPNNEKEVNHIDGNKLNNHINNLEWVSHKENMQHAWNNNLCENSVKASIRYSKDNPNAKRITQYDLKGNKIKEYDCIKDAEKETKIHRTNIGNCCNGRQKTAGKFIWKFS